MAVEDWIDVYAEPPDDDQPSEVECKFCGKGGLEWDDDNGAWVLIDRRGRIHNCRKSASADDFEDLT